MCSIDLFGKVNYIIVLLRQQHRAVNTMIVLLRQQHCANLSFEIQELPIYLSKKETEHAIYKQTHEQFSVG